MKNPNSDQTLFFNRNEIIFPKRGFEAHTIFTRHYHSHLSQAKDTQLQELENFELGDLVKKARDELNEFSKKIDLIPAKNVNISLFKKLNLSINELIISLNANSRKNLINALIGTTKLATILSQDIIKNPAIEDELYLLIESNELLKQALTNKKPINIATFMNFYNKLEKIKQDSDKRYITDDEKNRNHGMIAYTSLAIACLALVTTLLLLIAFATLATSALGIASGVAFALTMTGFITHFTLAKSTYQNVAKTLDTKNKDVSYHRQFQTLFAAKTALIAADPLATLKLKMSS